MLHSASAHRGQRERQGRRLTPEVHATIVHGDGVHACAAAVNGAQLRQIDPKRSRVVYAFNISPKTRSILMASWDVRDMSAGTNLLRSRKTVLFDARRMQDQPELFSRVLYWDTDMLPMTGRFSGANIDALFSVSPEADIVASPEGPGCFNAGFFLYKPSLVRREQYMRIIESATPPRTCGAFRNLVDDDQRAMNALYKPNKTASQIVRAIRSAYEPEPPNHTFYAPLATATFRVRTPYTLLGTNMPSASGVLQQPPWGANCAECLLAGLRCNQQLASRAKNGRPDCAYYPAQALWWSAYLRLPEEVRRTCDERLRETAGIEASFKVKDGSSGAGALAGCDLSNRTRG